MSPRRLPQPLATLLALGLISGCSETTVPVAGVYHPTLIEVSPDAFLSGVPCSGAAGAPSSVAGALQTYVATVFNVEYQADGTAFAGTAGDTGAPAEIDVGTDACPVDTTMASGENDGFALPSSNPIDCSKPVAFSRVVPEHRYKAKIDGYARADIEPLAPGAPIMVAKATASDAGKPVAPSWTFTCGQRCPVTARSYVTRTLEDCQLDADSPDAAPSGPAGIELGLTLGASGPKCGTGAGQVDHFEVAFAGGTLSAMCGENVTLSDVPTDGALSLPVLAYEAGKPDPRWGATCSAAPVPGLTVTALCPALSEQGALDIDPAAALTALATDCQGLASLSGALQLELLDEQGATIGQKRFVDSTSCSARVRFTGIPSGPARARATLLAAGSELRHALCNASVVPAQSVSAACSAEP